MLILCFQDASISAKLPPLPEDPDTSEAHAPGDLSIFPLDTTTSSAPDLSTLPQDTVPTSVPNLSVFPLDMTTATTVPNQSMYPLDGTSLNLSNLSLDTASATPVPNQSMYPLDSTSVTVPLDTTDGNLSNLPLDSTGDPHQGGTAVPSLATSSQDPESLQASLFKFHDIVCTLVRNYTTATAQVSLES